MGGLGNQLQQFALYRKFRSLGVEARLDISWYHDSKKQDGVMKREFELPFFEGLEYEICSSNEKKQLIGAEGLTGKIHRRIFPGSVRYFEETKMYHPEIFDFSDMYLSGYFSCERYYADILPLLREEIFFRPSGDIRDEETAAMMRDCESVAVHIRRGDYLEEKNRELYGNICTEIYYEKAIEYIRQQYPQACFFFFSDDSDYVHQHYNEEEFVHIDWNKGESSIYDLYLMSCCRHIICANSSFSFWGARLIGNEGKIMVRPERHYSNRIMPIKELAELWRGYTFIDSDGIVKEVVSSFEASLE
jgi:hypothetical protein